MSTTNHLPRLHVGAEPATCASSHMDELEQMRCELLDVKKERDSLRETINELCVLANHCRTHNTENNLLSDRSVVNYAFSSPSACDGGIGERSGLQELMGNSINLMRTLDKCASGLVLRPHSLECADSSTCEPSHAQCVEMLLARLRRVSSFSDLSKGHISVSPPSDLADGCKEAGIRATLKQGPLPEHDGPRVEVRPYVDAEGELQPSRPTGSHDMECVTLTDLENTEGECTSCHSTYYDKRDLWREARRCMNELEAFCHEYSSTALVAHGGCDQQNEGDELVSAHHHLQQLAYLQQHALAALVRASGMEMPRLPSVDLLCAYAPVHSAVTGSRPSSQKQKPRILLSHTVSDGEMFEISANSHEDICIARRSDDEKSLPADSIHETDYNGYVGWSIDSATDTRSWRPDGVSQRNTSGYRSDDVRVTSTPPPRQTVLLLPSFSAELLDE